MVQRGRRRVKMGRTFDQLGHVQLVDDVEVALNRRRVGVQDVQVDVSQQIDRPVGALGGSELLLQVLQTASHRAVRGSVCNSNRRRHSTPPHHGHPQRLQRPARRHRQLGDPHLAAVQDGDTAAAPAVSVSPENVVPGKLINWFCIWGVSRVSARHSTSSR